MSANRKNVDVNYKVTKNSKKMGETTLNFNKKYRKSRGSNQDINADIPQRLSVDKLRNQTMNLQEKPPPPHRDFGAYFLASMKGKDPTFAVTSHFLPTSIRTVKRVISTYPVTQLRWNPYVDTSPTEEDDSDGSYKCKCRKCTMKSCPSRFSPNSPPRMRSGFKDNITRFTDQSTMTLKLADTGIGSTPRTSSTRISEMSANTSDIAVRDTHATMRIHHLYSADKSPTPILKRHRTTSEEIPCSSKYCDDVEYSHEPERDFEGHYEPSRVNSIKSFFKCKKKSKHGNNRSRVVYNEGIDYLPPCHQPYLPYPVRVPCLPNVMNNQSRMSVRSRCNSDDGDIHIPHCHRNDSRYHTHCKNPQTKPRYVYDGEDVRHMVMTPEVRSNVFTSRPISFYQVPTIRLPRKMLTSDRDIEEYYGNRLNFYTPALSRH